MILTIASVLAFLVAINFLLLIFSCNKTTKKVDNKLPHAIKTEKEAATPTLVANQSKPRQLAPTGS